MQTVEHAGQEQEEWRAGVSTTMLVSAANGSSQLCIFDQICEPGLGAPTHLHAVEEVLTVLSGRAEIWLGDDRVTVDDGVSVVIPAGCLHGFRNAGAAPLHVRATLAAPIFEASYEDGTETPRRFLPGALSS